MHSEKTVTLVSPVTLARRSDN